MPPSCTRCASPRTLNLETAQRVGVVGSTLLGGAIGAWRATAMTGPLSLAVTRFPLAKLPAAITAANTNISLSLLILFVTHSHE